MHYFFRLALIAVFIPSAVARATEFPLPPPDTRASMVRKLAEEIVRLDGEGLIVRERNRRTSFASVSERLQGEARSAKTWQTLLRAFSRLDAAYPNLHASLKTAPQFSQKLHRPSLRFNPRYTPGGSVEYFVTNGEYAGAQILAINGRPIEDWKAEALEFCKFPLQLQCELELFSSLAREWLFWERSQSLRYTLEFKGRRFEQTVPLEKFAAPASKQAPGCEEDRNLYASYRAVHIGRFGCLFLRKDDSTHALLRISSFYYDPETEKGPIRSVSDEVDALWPWWKAHASGLSELIVDIAGNHGGNAPIEWYTILFTAPFQEQWVRFRKIPELENSRIRKQILFWGTPQQENWFQALLRDGTYSSTPRGGFLPPVPMFCAGDDRSNCLNGLFPVRDHGFRGQITLLLNQWCVSSCDGFAFALKDQLGDRVTVAGIPQAADTAYSRLKLQLFLDEKAPGGFRIAVDRREDSPMVSALVLSQGVAVTRSVEKNGRVVSGLPLEVQIPVEIPFELNERGWRAYAVGTLP